MNCCCELSGTAKSKFTVVCAAHQALCDGETAKLEYQVRQLLDALNCYPPLEGDVSIEQGAKRLAVEAEEGRTLKLQVDECVKAAKAAKRLLLDHGYHLQGAVMRELDKITILKMDPCIQEDIEGTAIKRECICGTTVDGMFRCAVHPDAKKQVDRCPTCGKEVDNVIHFCPGEKRIGERQCGCVGADHDLDCGLYCSAHGTLKPCRHCLGNQGR